MKWWYVLLVLLVGGCVSPALREAPSTPADTVDSPPPVGATLLGK